MKPSKVSPLPVPNSLVQRQPDPRLPTSHSIHQRMCAGCEGSGKSAGAQDEACGARAVSRMMSAVTAAGFSSPTRGGLTSITLKVCSGSAMRAHPSNRVTSVPSCRSYQLTNKLSATATERQQPSGAGLKVLSSSHYLADLATPRSRVWQCMPSRNIDRAALPRCKQNTRCITAFGLRRHLFRVCHAAHTAQHVGDVLPDLVRRLQPEQVEVAQQVVVDGQELQVQLRQRQARLPCSQRVRRQLQP